MCKRSPQHLVTLLALLTDAGAGRRMTKCRNPSEMTAATAWSPDLCLSRPLFFVWFSP